MNNDVMNNFDGSAPRGRPQTVLIIDDDDEIRHVLGLLFDIEEFDVVGGAASGIDGVALAAKFQPDFVVLDQMMPNLAGHRTAALIKTIAPETRIIAFSAYLNDLPEWADAYLNKDRISELVPLLASLIPGSTPISR
jgi:CheY-like chemotaxis protein